MPLPRGVAHVGLPQPQAPTPAPSLMCHIAEELIERGFNGMLVVEPV